jgi:hypothetical protein
LELLFGHGLAELSGYSFEVFKRHFSGGIIIEKSKGLQNFLSGVPLTDFSGHEFHEVGEFDDSLAVSIYLCDHLFNFFLFGFEAQGSHGYLELFRVDVSWNKTNNYQLTRCRTSRKLPLFTAFVPQSAHFWPFWLASEELFLF